MMEALINPTVAITWPHTTVSLVITSYTLNLHTLYVNYISIKMWKKRK